jgi:predicted aspartyl protease
MYKYELINNHYIVNINDKKYLIDTGCPFSFWIGEQNKEIEIDGIKYSLVNTPTNFNIEKSFKLVGTELDGFIGMDIISKTSLTIYKNNNLEFNSNDVNGREIKMTKSWPLMIDIGTNLLVGKFIIDTGARYGYGISSVFYNKTPFSKVTDYNPSLGELESDIYHLDVVIGGIKRTIDVCNNDVVGKFLIRNNTIMIGSISSLFDEVCVIDTKEGRLILK